MEQTQYLAQAADCEACHTTEHGTPFAGGRPFETEFGTIYSPNITPDAETGIGSWSDAEFVHADARRHRQGRQAPLSGLPVRRYTHLTDEDVLAIRAYLVSRPGREARRPQEHALR